MVEEAGRFMELQGPYASQIAVFWLQQRRVSPSPTSSFCTRKEHQIYSLRTFGIPKIFFWKPFVTGQSYRLLQLIRKGLLFTAINYIYSIDYYMLLRFFLWYSIIRKHYSWCTKISISWLDLFGALISAKAMFLLILVY